MKSSASMSMLAFERSRTWRVAGTGDAPGGASGIVALLLGIMSVAAFHGFFG